MILSSDLKRVLIEKALWFLWSHSLFEAVFLFARAISSVVSSGAAAQ
ncbi:hypothetical protein [Acetobacter sp. DsW_059]|nr:hypothetical protein [Acetobacter sp. DsW_059]